MSSHLSGQLSLRGIAVGLYVLALATFGSTAHAQLERLLAPIEIPQQVVKKEQPVEKSLAPTTPEKARDPLLFTGEDLLREIKPQVIDHFSLTGDLVLDLARPWGTVKVPDPNVVVTVMDYPREGLSNTFTVRCKVASGSQTIGEWQISLRARLWQEVWVAATRLDRGQPLEESMVNPQKVDVMQNRNALLATDTSPSSYEMAQNVNTGLPLTKRDVVEKPVIHKNQIVEVVASRGPLAITMKAQALENGAAKALIRMRNLDSKREFTAQVINETRVHVFF